MDQPDRNDSPKNLSGSAVLGKDQPDRNDSPKNLSGSAVLGKDQPDRNDSEERVPEFRGSVVPRFGYS